MSANPAQTPDEHYLEAERLLRVAQDAFARADEYTNNAVTFALARAQVHATLAAATDCWRAE